MKNKIVNFLILLVFIISNPYSCGKEYIFASESDCDDCYSPKPDYGPLKIKLTENKSADGVIVKIYKGKFTEDMRFDDTNLYSVDTTNLAVIEIDVPLDNYYSVVAQYNVNGIFYNVVDGDKIKVLSISNTCDFDCWIIRGGSINCRLKF